VFGPGKAELLEHIAKTGSITQAAKAMGMSYMRAWSLVKSLERGFAEPLVLKLRGGHTRGGAELSQTGREVLRLYRELESTVVQAADRVRPLFSALLK
jgi:molybdate transport system regulatory protein